MWVVIHMAKGKQRCDAIEAALTKDGVLVKIKPAYRNVSESDNYFQICVLQSETEQARQVLVENGF
ncbi:MAG: hypothetical protein ACOX8S_06910 [Christensenellales bacterium]|jgi:hypothetical protein